MSMKQIPDRWNPKKIWVIKRFGCGHYYMNQMIDGKMFYPRFQRTTRAHLESVGVLVSPEDEQLISDSIAEQLE